MRTVISASEDHSMVAPHQRIRAAALSEQADGWDNRCRGAKPIETASEFEIIETNHRWILKLSHINIYEIDSYI
jgi:hypothetical protein